MNWSLFFDLTVSGLTLGSLYALIALGYSMVYGILKLLNFAHGDVYMIGAFLGWYTLHALGGPMNPTISGAAVVLLLMFIVAMLGCGVLGVAIERFAYRPLRNAPRIAPLISALGVSIFLQNSALLDVRRELQGLRHVRSDRRQDLSASASSSSRSPSS